MLQNPAPEGLQACQRPRAEAVAVACCLQAYDLVAGTHGLTLSRYVSPKESHRQFPTLSETHSVDETTRHLKGTVSALLSQSASLR